MEEDDRKKQLMNQAVSQQSIGVALGASAQLLGSLLSDKARMKQRQKAQNLQAKAQENESDQRRLLARKERSRGALGRLVKQFGKEIT
ncbi:hypothetical protein GOV11_04140 [Candidatus Woesearchaeota archaeon]|nr:hypothetical protein [Candidatus Woesearchaeota archaeon]